MIESDRNKCVFLQPNVRDPFLVSATTLPAPRPSHPQTTPNHPRSRGGEPAGRLRASERLTAATGMAWPLEAPEKARWLLRLDANFQKIQLKMCLRMS